MHRVGTVLLAPLGANPVEMREEGGPYTRRRRLNLVDKALELILFERIQRSIQNRSRETFASLFLLFDDHIAHQNQM